jgi:hypothetical protein
MKAHSFLKTSPTQQSKFFGISFSELALVAFYFLAVWLIPTSWLDSAAGELVFAAVSKFNPYLSEYSISFSADPAYFIHCHVLATFFFSIAFPILIIKKNSGQETFIAGYRKKMDQFGGWFVYLILSIAVFGLMGFSMIWLVDYPLTRGERAIWISSIAPSALMFSGFFGIGAMQIYMILFSTFSNKGMRR